MADENVKVTFVAGGSKSPAPQDAWLSLQIGVETVFNRMKPVEALYDTPVSGDALTLIKKGEF